MTQEYKENILNQLVGNVQEGTGSNVPQFSNAETITTTLNTYIANAGHTQTNSLSFWLMRNNKILLFYNEYSSSYSYLSSFVVIVDNDFQPIAIINTLESGNPLPMFSVTISNDTGEGRIYFVSIISGRLYYINDPTSKKETDTYHINILNSYELQLTGSILGSFKKNANGGNFVFATLDYGTYHIYITEFVNNVGMPNEWNTYEYNHAETGFSSDLDFYPLWTNGFSCRVVYYATDDGNAYINVLDTQEVDNVKSLTLTKKIETDVVIASSRATLLSYTKFAFLESYPTKNNLRLVDLATSKNIVLYQFTNSTFTVLKAINNILFVENVDNSKNLTVGLVQDEVFYPKSLGTLTGTTASMFILNTYNLYTISFLDGSNVVKTYLIYNVNNYNGSSFNGVNSCTSNTGVLYDTNNKPIFARNLYNKTFINNTEIDTLNVPNFMLNDKTISTENILSLNNNIIINESQDITKNQYENLFLNFFNTINIIDNNTGNNIQNKEASTYFLNGINSNQYDNLQSLKYKVTYEDSTTDTNTITNVSISNLTATLSFVLYVPKTINTIEIISNDESISYATLPSQTYNLNSYYKIEQEITVQ